MAGSLLKPRKWKSAIENAFGGHYQDSRSRLLLHTQMLDSPAMDRTPHAFFFCAGSVCFLYIFYPWHKNPLSIHDFCTGFSYSGCLQLHLEHRRAHQCRFPLTNQSKLRRGGTFDPIAVNNGGGEADPGCHWQPSSLWSNTKGLPWSIFEINNSFPLF